MTSLARAALGGLLLALGQSALAPFAHGQSAGNKVELKHVKYDELGRLVRGHSGKVVLVTFWHFT
jgi:hypothetical protein